MIDFRDFAECGRETAATGGAPAALRGYAEAGILHSFDLVLAADVVYESSSSELVPYVCAAMLRRCVAGDRTRATTATLASRTRC